MYFYKFESIDYEQQEAFELAHWKKFSSCELDEMVKDAIAHFIENEYDPFLFSPCNLDIGDLFFDGHLQNTLIKQFGFDKIDFESKVSYSGEPLFRDNSNHKDEIDFKEILANVKVPKCVFCNKKACLIDNERF